MEYIVALLTFVIGCVLAWVLAGSRARAAESVALELRQQVQAKEEELRQVREQLNDEKTTRVRTEILLAEAEKKMDEQKKLLEEARQRLSDTFNALAGDALKSNNQAFLELAKETLQVLLTEAKGDLVQRQQAIEAMVNPLKEALKNYEEGLRKIEEARSQAYGDLKSHLEQLGKAQQLLQTETQRLVTALRTPKVRGRWGEITLQRVIELAGLSPYCDFCVQPTGETDEGRRRPDVIVNLPNGKKIILDAKTPLDAYWEAVEAADEDGQRNALLRHAQAVRTSVAALSSKDYQSHFQASLDFVVLFLPGEAFFAAAVEHDASLIEDAMKKRVLLATPITLLALLKAVAYGWQQQQATENAERVIEAGRQLFERVCVFADHLAGIRKGLLTAVNSYNEAIGSWQSRLVPGARRLKELGAAPAQKELKEIEEVDVVPREVLQTAAQDTG
ncbi:MAG: DNA recombination protein RmuC [Desulfotomaculales bacterium]